jgi:WD40 repeat protein
VPAGRKIVTVRGIGAPVAFSPDGTRLAGTQGDGVVLHDVTGPASVVTVPGQDQAGAFALSPDGRRVAVGFQTGTNTNVVKVLDVPSGQARFTLTHAPRKHVVKALAFSGDGKLLVSTGTDRTIQVWDMTTGRRLKTLQGPNEKRFEGDLEVAFSPDDLLLAAPGEDGTVKLWDSGTFRARVTLEGSAGCDSKPAFSPDGRRVVLGICGVRVGGLPWRVRGGALANTLRVWDAQSGRELYRMPALPDGTLSDVAHSRDGRVFVAGSRVVKVYAAATGEEMPLGEVSAWRGVLALSPDGERLATVARDVVKVWDARNGEELLTLRGPPIEFVKGLAFSRDGSRLAACDNKGTVVVWEGAPCRKSPAAPEP